eukprot:scaffold51016_cov67-Attheya_sp.AAC.1
MRSPTKQPPPNHFFGVVLFCSGVEGRSSRPVDTLPKLRAYLCSIWGGISLVGVSMAFHSRESSEKIVWQRRDKWGVISGIEDVMEWAYKWHQPQEVGECVGTCSTTGGIQSTVPIGILRTSGGILSIHCHLNIEQEQIFLSKGEVNIG